MYGPLQSHAFSWFLDFDQCVDEVITMNGMAGEIEFLRDEDPATCASFEPIDGYV